MEISSNLNLGGVDAAASARRAKNASKTDLDNDQDQVSLNNSKAIQNALENVPASRADSVARARDLINDPNYPGADVTAKLSQFLADKLSNE